MIRLKPLVRLSKKELLHLIPYSLVEVIIKESSNYQLDRYQNFDKLDILALLVLEDPLLTKEDLCDIEIDYKQAFTFTEVVGIAYRRLTILDNIKNVSIQFNC